ncbi:MAG: hypothetical protein CL920_36880 [Deltaproteobacteria bacterium]|nr:hypothetical protein [Deltaproteobacteria bacterium]MBU54306.1 hypothetical protein [Deltaproteobacteria bacterium]|tara:strand:+ start:11146 stop:11979 length:834 start_codon:yes stop_codon:yes gene_type:complete
MRRLLRNSPFLWLFIATFAFVTPAQAKETKKPASVLSQQQKRQLFEKGNKLYNSGQYAAAIAVYTKLYKPGKWENFEVLYNLGNSYYRLHQYGMALAYYRKAELLRPNHEALLHNLQLLHRQTKKDSTQGRKLRAKFLFWYYLLNLGQLFYVILFVTALALLLWGLHIRRSHAGKHNLRWVVAALATIALVFWTSFGIKYFQERHTVRGVVVKNKITVRSGYGKNFEGLFLLTEADEVIIKEKTTGWLHIEITLPDEKTKVPTLQSGWVPESAILKI